MRRPSRSPFPRSPWRRLDTRTCDCWLCYRRNGLTPPDAKRKLLDAKTSDRYDR